MKTILQKHTTINRRYFVRRSRTIVPTIQSHIINDINNRVPEIVKDRLRTVEVAGGRSAICGLLIGTIVNNVKGITFSDQIKSEEHLVFVMTMSIFMFTIIPNIEMGFKKDDKLIYELKIYRFSMMILTIIFLL